MSEVTYTFIPTRPEEVITPEGLARAQALAQEIFPDASVHATTSPDVAFFDSGNNLESITCPGCSTSLSLEAWQTAMSTAHATGFSDRSIEMPCCRIPSKLEKLHYDWHCGFARSRIEVRSPGKKSSADDLARLSAAAGTRLQVVRSRL